MRAVDLIRTKRDGGELASEQIAAFVQAATHGSWPDYQLAAMLMAICIRGMTNRETAAFTHEMTNSGIRINLDELPGPKVDKHSTGGVGDKTSLILAPLAAACGAIVPMMSGRGLGHTGGTLDKLEAIPGFRVNLSIPEFRETLKKIGMAMIGQTADVAPADRKLYALRDVTGTVESLPLITASILSKKLSEGISALILDVKCGRGAMMKTRDTARALAESLVRVSRANGLKVEAVITPMDAPTGRAVGNGVEVVECIETLKGRGPKDLEDLSVLLAARMVRLAGLTETDDEAERKVRSALASGAGLEKFRQLVELQGGDPRAIDDYSLLQPELNRLVVSSPRAGFVSVMDAEKIGIAAGLLGAGRQRAEDKVDPAVGILLELKPGDRVEVGDPVYSVLFRGEEKLPAAIALLNESLVIGDTSFPASPLVLEAIR